jgi:ribose 5-phosphate isomerase RpiB
VDAKAARNAREHNDANVLALGAQFVDAARAAEIAEVFLSARCTEEGTSGAWARSGTSRRPT